MKILHFDAVSPHPNVTLALQGQVYQAIRPFHTYLHRAIHTAQQRSRSLRLPWEPAQDQVTLDLTARDTAFEAPRLAPGVLLTDVPRDFNADTSQPGFVTNRASIVRFSDPRWTPEGLVVNADLPLTDGDEVMWCRTATGVRPEPPPPAPSTITTEEGEALDVIALPQAAGDSHWRFVVAGRRTDTRLRLDGVAVDVRALAPADGLRHLSDATGGVFVGNSLKINAERWPADGPLTGDNGVRYEWRAEGRNSGSFTWVQLLPPDAIDPESTMDPRAAFCEGDVSEVYASPKKGASKKIKVKRVDSDRYRLLLAERPPGDSVLELPVNTRNLKRQAAAIQQLRDHPLPHHQGLLRLLEDPTKARFPAPAPIPSEKIDWQILTDMDRDGTAEQRDFVAKALATPDLAILEGPPGSGKTTAICELVVQLLRQGQRVLVCGSTHVAIDNVLERLLDRFPTEVDAVRIGHADRIDEKVAATRLDERIDALLRAWRTAPSMRSLGDDELRQMAQRAVLMSANLTCATTMGITGHPTIAGEPSSRNGAKGETTATLPPWDVLIVDEASKTLIQEFLVPAMFARRWIIVGDVRQLPPFTDRDDLLANLRHLLDANGKPVFPPEVQRAALLRWRLGRRDLRESGARWLIVEPPAVLDALEAEMAARPEVDGPQLARVVADGRRPRSAIATVALSALKGGAPQALHLAAADWVLVGEDVFEQAAASLPADLLLAEDVERSGLPKSHPLRFRRDHWQRTAGELARWYRDRSVRADRVDRYDQAERCEQDWLVSHDIAGELAWRLTRRHELRRAKSAKERDKLTRQLGEMAPASTDIRPPIYELEDIGLPSILEVLQEGIGADREDRRSSLTIGLKHGAPQAFEARFASLSFQHRMHPEIALFPREMFYRGEALNDANTIADRDRKAGWAYPRFDARRVWVHIAGSDRGGVNKEEVAAMREVLRDFLGWAGAQPSATNGQGKPWEVACLAFYSKQQEAISKMLQALTGQPKQHTRFAVRNPAVEIVCGTVDRFQGREADLVLLSMRNTARVGFLDSPNRLNVAITRARHQLAIFGNADWFGGTCPVPELSELAKSSRRVDDYDRPSSNSPRNPRSRR